LTGRKNTFINFPRKMLLEGTASILPPQQTVAEILENVGADEDLLDACRALRDRGYRLALDDFTVPEKVEALTSIADSSKWISGLPAWRNRMDAATRFKARSNSWREGGNSGGIPPRADMATSTFRVSSSPPSDVFYPPDPRVQAFIFENLNELISRN